MDKNVHKYYHWSNTLKYIGQLPELAGIQVLYMSFRKGEHSFGVLQVDELLTQSISLSFQTVGPLNCNTFIAFFAKTPSAETAFCVAFPSNMFCIAIYNDLNEAQYLQTSWNDVWSFGQTVGHPDGTLLTSNLPLQQESCIPGPQ